MAQVRSKYGQAAVSILFVAIISSLSSTGIDATCLSSIRNNSLRGDYEPIEGLPTDCGKHWGNHHRIAGGREAYDGEFPSYFPLNLGPNFCGATIISDRHILTAAHCFDLFNRKNLLIRSGNFQNAQFEKACVDPNYDRASTTHDVAILKLRNRIQFSTNQQPACLPSGPVFYGESYIAIGMGAIDEKQQPSSKLKVLKMRNCSLKFPSKLCMVPNERGMICGGDSGSGIYAIRNNRHTVIGVESIGDPGCVADHKGIAFATDVYGLMNSIRHLMRNCA